MSIMLTVCFAVAAFLCVEEGDREQQLSKFVLLNAIKL